MNLPNLLSVSRILLVPVLIICLIQGYHMRALLVFVLAGITDALDGFFARILHQKTVLGSYLDPLADKALIASSFVTLSILGIIPAWLTVIVISRDSIILLGILVLSLLSVRFEIRPAFISKITTALQLAAIFVALASASSPLHFDNEIKGAVYWLTAIFTVLSGGAYLMRGIRFINQEST